MTTTPLSTTNTDKSLHQDVVVVTAQDAVPDALILSLTTKAGNVEGDEPQLLVPYVDLDPAVVGFVPEADAIGESSPTSRQVAIGTGKIGTIVTVSREQYGQGRAADLVSTAVRSAVTRKANDALLAQAAPTASAHTPPAGLLNQGVHSGGALSDGDGLDKLVDAVAHIESHGGTASHVLVNPTSWATVSKIKQTDTSAVPLVNQSVAPAGRSLLGLPVVTDRAIPANTLIVIDRSAWLSVYGQLAITTSTEYAYDRDAIALRVTWRFGTKVVDPNRMVKLSVTSTGS